MAKNKKTKAKVQPLLKFKNYAEYKTYYESMLTEEKSAAFQARSLLCEYSVPVTWSYNNDKERLNAHFTLKDFDSLGGLTISLGLPIRVYLTKKTTDFIVMNITKLPTLEDDKVHCSGIIAHQSEDKHFENQAVKCGSKPSKTVCNIRCHWIDAIHQRMMLAIQNLPSKIDESVFKAILGDVESNTFLTDEEVQKQNYYQPKTLPKLNQYQESAVKRSLASKFTLIQGPPGTGKTTTAAVMTANFVKQRKNPAHKVLVCAPSNIAVDHLAKKLITAGLNIVRISSRCREDVPVHDKELEKHTLHKILENEPKLDHGKYRKSLSKDKQLEWDNSSKQARRKIIQNQRNIMLREREKTVISKSDVICTTAINAGSPTLTPFEFSACIIDESTQAIEPEMLVPIVKCSGPVVVIGDQKQLGPVLASESAARKGLKYSLFERLLMCDITCVRLSIQYRMHPAISEFPNENYYNGEIQDGVKASERQKHKQNLTWPDASKPIIFVDVDGEERRSGRSKSWANTDQIRAVYQFIEKLLRSGVTSKEIGVITPYAGQKSELISRMYSVPEYRGIEIASVNQFQGREKEFIIVSTVRSNKKASIGFCDDARRINVALTRAKCGLIIIGSKMTLQGNGGNQLDSGWGKLIQFYDKSKCLFREDKISMMFNIHVDEFPIHESMKSIAKILGKNEFKSKCFYAEKLEQTDVGKNVRLFTVTINDVKIEALGGALLLKQKTKIMADTFLKIFSADEPTIAGFKRAIPELYKSEEKGMTNKLNSNSTARTQHLRYGCYQISLVGKNDIYLTGLPQTKATEEFRKDQLETRFGVSVGPISIKEFLGSQSSPGRVKLTI